MAVMASKMPEVAFTVFDDNPKTVCACQCGPLPFYEPSLDRLVDELRGKNLSFSPSLAQTVEKAQIVFVCINTPLKKSGLGSGRAADLSSWDKVARRIVEASKDECKIIVECSTMPMNTGKTMRQVFQASATVKHEVLCFPAFYRGGTAITDMQTPRTVLLGSDETPSGLMAYNVFIKLISPWIPTDKVVHSSLWSAELAKHARNAMIAQRISSANAVSALCEKTGADLEEVMRVARSDSRISDGYLQACPGIGGNTLLHNMQMVVWLAESLQLEEVAEYWKAVVEMNEWQQTRFCDNIPQTMGNVKDKRVAILGFAYKPETDDTRSSPAIAICKSLLEEGAKLALYDPQVSTEQMAAGLGGYSAFSPQQVSFCASAMDALKGAQALVLVTAWEEFKELDMTEVVRAMAAPPFLFDSRGVWEPADVSPLGFELYQIGKPRRE
eukprot:CAMPEP_0181307368 /NCGR_PEP_ID=MMETSP1101-20121128/10840_1 /TAXON_ID=46948 /ORGANISM="Rhodomonas abbreviata, Strain Caron Lab Isolate" /LENGTH=441 /DNA_ID=CAMNT_0023413575 /DNA_START=199 /DNA_END=1524 /DNA_ORIENTATION=+